MKRHDTLGTLLPILLLALFCLCILSVIAGGAGIYRDLTDAAQMRLQEGQCLPYVAAKVRAFDMRGAVSVREFDGISALCLTEELDGEAYCTYIYCTDGEVRELFTEADAPFDTDGGQTVLTALSLRFSYTDGVLTASFVGTDGIEQTLTSVLRSEATG